MAAQTCPRLFTLYKYLISQIFWLSPPCLLDHLDHSHKTSIKISEGDSSNIRLHFTGIAFTSAKVKESIFRSSAARANIDRWPLPLIFETTHGWRCYSSFWIHDHAAWESREVLHFRDFTIQLKSDWPCCLPIHLLGGFFSLSSTFPRSLHIQMSTYLGSKPGVE